jgi:hypothetical protein
LFEIVDIGLQRLEVWQPASTVNAATAAALIIALFMTNPLIGG